MGIAVLFLPRRQWAAVRISDSDQIVPPQRKYPLIPSTTASTRISAMKDHLPSSAGSPLTIRPSSHARTDQVSDERRRDRQVMASGGRDRIIVGGLKRPVSVESEGMTCQVDGVRLTKWLVTECEVILMSKGQLCLCAFPVSKLE